MTQEQWTAVDGYITDRLVHPDAALDAALKASADAGMPAISVTPSQGKFLHLLARIQGARTILEIGTLGGYSTIWLARALRADGRLVTIEADPKFAAVALQNIENAGLSNVVDLRVGRALDTLPRLVTEGFGFFDMIFIDADKPNTPDYFAWALKFSRRGGLIVVDNVVRKGALIDVESTDPNVIGMRCFCEMVANEPRVSATAIQTVGSKGHDGFVIALVTSD